MKGFTLLETLVAVTILVVSIMAPMTIAQNALQNAIYARDQVTAFYLAQEGIEYVRALRDKNIMQGNPWLQKPAATASCVSPVDLSACVAAAGSTGCNIDFVNFCDTLCTTPSGCAPLLFSNTGYSTVGAGTPSKYTRTVTLEQITAKQYKIKVHMDWKSGRYPRQFDLEEIIMDWYN